MSEIYFVETMRGLRNGSIRSPFGIDRACECD